MAFMKDILTRNIPIWEECAATPFVQEVQTGKLPLEKFKGNMVFIRNLFHGNSLIVKF